jgi:hypothetical protein
VIRRAGSALLFTRRASIPVNAPIAKAGPIRRSTTANTDSNERPYGCLPSFDVTANVGVHNRRWKVSAVSASFTSRTESFKIIKCEPGEGERMLVFGSPSRLVVYRPKRSR